MARLHGWSLKVTARGSCFLKGTDANQDCARWNDLVIEELLRERPDAVVIEGTEVNRRGEQPELVLDPEGEGWKRLTDAGIDVFALRAAPRFLESPPECVRTDDDTLGRDCDREAAIMFAPRSPFAPVAARSAKLHELDLVSLYCPAGTCPVVLGNLITSRDTRHFTAAFTRTLAPALAEKMREAVPELFADPAR